MSATSETAAAAQAEPEQIGQRRRLIIIGALLSVTTEKISRLQDYAANATRH